MTNNNEVIDVSVILITYNQEQYIKDALDSILMQKHTLSVEVLVGEDCSTDNTRGVIGQYEKEHPGLLSVIYNPVNLGATRNLYQLLAVAKGKYIALLEGDDYWLGEDRLQTLYDFLESHPENSAVSHRRERRNQNGELLGYDPDAGLVDKVFTLDDFMCGKTFSAMGCMFRNVFRNCNKPYEKALTATRNACDMVICHIVLHNGTVFILDKCFSVYRVLTGDGNSNYCSMTKQHKVDADYIAEYNAVAFLYGDNHLFKKMRTYYAFDAIMFCTKRNMIAERKNFYNNLIKADKRLLILNFPKNLIQRIFKHMMRRQNG